MSAPIITPELVRRYLKATSRSLRAKQRFAATEEKGGLDAAIAEIGLDRARLGMLTAAEILFARAAKLESSTSLDGSYDAAMTKLARKREAEILRDAAATWYEVEGVGPDRLVCAESAEEAAEMVVAEERTDLHALELHWIDGGSNPRDVARYEFEGTSYGCVFTGRVTVARVEPLFAAWLEDRGYYDRHVYEAADLRREYAAVEVAT